MVNNKIMLVLNVYRDRVLMLYLEMKLQFNHQLGLQVRLLLIGKRYSLYFWLYATNPLHLLAIFPKTNFHFAVAGNTSLYHKLLQSKVQASHYHVQPQLNQAKHCQLQELEPQAKRKKF